MTTVVLTSLLDGLRQRLAAAAERRAAGRAEHAQRKKYRHVATVRATVYEYNPIICYSDTYQGHAYLLENGYGKRKIEANCPEISRSTAVRAFRNGMDLADVSRMCGQLGFNIAQ